jgi:hypothetical protein
MKFNAIVAAIFGLLVSVTMAIPAADNGLVAHSNGLKGRSNKLVPIDNNDVAVTDALTNNRVVTNHIFTRSNNTASEVATIAATNKNLFTITLCDGANRSGQCTDVQMQNNYCMALPILINTISVYIPPQTWW